MNKFISQYLSNPKNCKNCKVLLPYEKRYNTFCNSSCAATYNNLASDSSRKKGPKPKIDWLVGKERSKESARLKRWTSKICGPYSKLIKSHCSVCGIISFGPNWKKFCNDHLEKYSHTQRARYCFTFKLFDYPDLFDFSLLKKYGMRSNSNLNGVVRDHRVSVAEAIKNNYDPYYIKHPLNCELMLHNNNIKKNIKSSLTYIELKKLVDAYSK